MDKLAFVFTGQGAQAPGMGRELYGQSAPAKAVLDKLEALRPGTLEQCFAGTADVLKDTRNTQPCLFAVSMAAAAALRAAGVAPDALAGFSLGEVSALTCGGALSLEEGFALVQTRGALMAEAAEAWPGTMAAVLKLGADRVTELAEAVDEVYPVNFNAPGQTVVAGTDEALARFKPLVREAGGRLMPLNVGGGFHSPFMADAAEAFRKELTGRQFRPLDTPVYANMTARPYGADIAGTMADQIISPVRWQETVENMVADGVTTFVELGPGKTLIGLIAKCTDRALCLHVEDMASLEETLKGLGKC